MIRSWHWIHEWLRALFLSIRNNNVVLIINEYQGYWLRSIVHRLCFPDDSPFITLNRGDEPTVSSSNYPNNYTNNAYEVWRVTAPEDYSVVVRVVDLDLDQGYDFLDIGYGRSPGSLTRLQDLTGSEVPQYAITSPGSELWIRFTSNSFEVRSGFLLQLSTERTEGTCHIERFEKGNCTDCLSQLNRGPIMVIFFLLQTATNQFNDLVPLE